MIDKFQYTIILPKTKGEGNWQQTKWCEENFGKRWSVIDNRDGVWACWWGGRDIPGSYRYEFKNEKDAMLFSLRWL